MTKSELFPALSDVQFAEKSPVIIEKNMITGYETHAERSIAKGDPVRLFLETIALLIIQQREKIDYAAKMNLLAYATGDYLDHIGASLNVTRLKAAYAVTTLKFVLSEAQLSAVIIPAGTRVSGGGDILFATIGDYEIPAGETEAFIAAQCTISGVSGNGFIAGQLKKIVDPFPFEMTVENITETSGGADVENDENFRERIQIAPESFSVAGPYGAYEFFARSAHQDIINVAVLGQPDAAPGTVEIYPLMTGGVIPSQEILDLVAEACSDRTKRPLNDKVIVNVPEAVNYDLDVKYYIDRAKSTQAAAISSAVNQAVSDWILWQRSRLGRDINPSELNYRMIAAGAKRTEIKSPEFKELKAWQVAVNENLNIVYGGLEDG